MMMMRLWWSKVFYLLLLRSYSWGGHWSRDIVIVWKIFIYSSLLNTCIYRQNAYSWTVYREKWPECYSWLEFVCGAGEGFVAGYIPRHFIWKIFVWSENRFWKLWKLQVTIVVLNVNWAPDPSIELQITIVVLNVNWAPGHYCSSQRQLSSRSLL